MGTRAALMVLPGVVAFLLYAPSLRNPLVWDDEIHVPRMRVASALAAFEREPGGYRRPLVLLSYSAQSRAGLDDAAALHAANVASHGINGALLAILLLRFGAAAAVALLAGVLFVAHPLQWAAVAYVSGRTDLLAAFFTLVALHAAFTAVRGGRGAAALMLAAIACAALSKESGLLAGPLCAALWWCEQRQWRLNIAARLQDDTAHARAGATIARTVVPMGSGFVIAVLTIAVATLALALYVRPPALTQSAMLGLAPRLRAVGAAMTTYAHLLIVPSGLHLDRLTPVDGVRDLVVGIVSVAVGLAIVIAFVLRPTRLRFALLSLALLWLPASNLLPISPAIASTWIFTGEQLAYLPLAPLAAIVALGIVRLLDAVASSLGASVRSSRELRSRFVVAASTAVALLLTIAWAGPVRARQRDMADPEALYRATLAHSPSPRACFNLGVALLARGQAAEAAKIYERCAAISPNDAGVYVQLGVANQKAGDRNKAELAYAKALELDDRDPYAWSNYATLEASAGFYDSARAKWQRALQLDSGFAPALEGLEKLNDVEERARAARPPS